MRLSIVVPVYNEEAIISHLVERMENLRPMFKERFGITAEDIEILYVNDGSRDNSLPILQSMCYIIKGMRVVNLSRNHGHQIAITAGIETARGDAVVVIDGDLQDPPETIPELYAKMLEGYDVVYAQRKKREGETFFKLWTAKLFYRTLKKLTNVDVPLDTGDFRIMSRRVVDVLNSMPEKHRFIRGMISWIGFNQTAYEYERHERFAGSTKYTLSKMLKFAVDGITSFSSIPLRIASYLGLFIAVTGFLYALYVIYLALFTHSTAVGWSSLMVVVLLLGGAQLLSLGLIGEYLARIHDESKQRPLFIIEDIYESPKNR